MTAKRRAPPFSKHAVLRRGLDQPETVQMQGPGRLLTATSCSSRSAFGSGSKSPDLHKVGDGVGHEARRAGCRGGNRPSPSCRSSLPAFTCSGPLGRHLEASPGESVPCDAGAAVRKTTLCEAGRIQFQAGRKIRVGKGKCGGKVSPSAWV